MADLATLGRPALGGGPLAGNKIVKMAFIDEAGTGNPAEEPYLVLAGVIVDADKKWKAVEKYLVQLAEDVFDGSVPAGFSFHATELFSGGKTFTREKYSKTFRWEILDALVAIPAKFELPVFWHRVVRADQPDVIDCYKSAFLEVASSIEAHMRVQPDMNEIASIILEDLPDVRHHVKDLQTVMQKFLHHVGLHAHHRDRLWLTRVIGQPHFEGKSLFSPLQVADACAFAVKRQLMKRPDSTRFFEPLVPMWVDCENPNPGSYEYTGQRF